MKRFSFLLCLILLPVMVSAGTVFRCLDPKTKKTTFSDEPCAAEHLLKSVKQYEADNPEIARRNAEIQAAKERQILEKSNNQQPVQPIIIAGNQEQKSLLCADLEWRKKTVCGIRNPGRINSECGDLIYQYNAKCR